MTGQDPRSASCELWLKLRRVSSLGFRRVSGYVDAYQKILIFQRSGDSEMRAGREVKARVSRKLTLYIPKAIAEAVGIREGSFVKMRVEGSRIVIEPVPDPFDLALTGPKFAKTTFEEFERESEEMQREILG